MWSSLGSAHALLVFYHVFVTKRHSVDQCSAEQNRARPDHLTPTRSRTSPRGLSRSKINLKGASETTVKILLQRKHLRGSAENPVQVFGFGGRCPAAACSDLFSFSQRVSTMAGPTRMETCGTRSWARSWNASFARVMMVTRTANASAAPLSTRASILWNQLERAVRRVQVIRGDSRRSRLLAATTHFLFFFLGSKANQTQCYPGYKNNLLVYKVESSLSADPPNTVRIIAVERQRSAEVEVQVWKSVEGA